MTWQKCTDSNSELMSYDNVILIKTEARKISINYYREWTLALNVFHCAIIDQYVYKVRTYCQISRLGYIIK